MLFIYSWMRVGCRCSLLLSNKVMECRIDDGYAVEGRIRVEGEIII